MNDTSYEFKSVISLSFAQPYFHKITEFGREKVRGW